MPTCPLLLASACDVAVISCFHVEAGKWNVLICHVSFPHRLIQRAVIFCFQVEAGEWNVLEKLGDGQYRGQGGGGKGRLDRGPLADPRLDMPLPWDIVDVSPCFDQNPSREIRDENVTST